MIRIFRSPPSSFTAAPGEDAVPTLVGSSIPEVTQKLESTFDRREVEALQRALVQLDAASRYDIVLAAGGTLFRVFPRDGGRVDSSAAGPGTAAPGWLAREREGLVLVVSPSETPTALVDALRFVGYVARGEVVSPLDEAPLTRVLLKHEPVAVVFTRSFPVAATHVAACRKRGCAVVAVRSGGPLDGVDAVISAPVSVLRLAWALDPAIATARSSRKD